MSSLFTIVTVPGAGTEWYARLFTTDRSFCFHGLTTVLRPYPSNLVFGEWFEGQSADHDFEQAHRRLLLQGFPQYFSRHWEQFEPGIAAVGNSDGYALPFLPALWLLWREMRFVFSDRDGIGAVHALANRSPNSSWFESSQRTRFGTSDVFEVACHDWAVQVVMQREHRSWLEERGASCIATRLETVTSDAEELRRVWDWLIGDWPLYRDRNVALLPAAPDTGADQVLPGRELWESWSREWRDAFVRICGETQVRLGYELPAA